MRVCTDIITSLSIRQNCVDIIHHCNLMTTSTADGECHIIIAMRNFQHVK